MATELKVPSFGESVTEAYLGEWLKSEGDVVKQEDPVVVIETDKVTAELPAPITGKVTKILKKTGDTAEIGEVIGYMEPAEIPGGEGEAAAEPSAGSEPAPASSPAGPTGGHVMPAAGRVLAEAGVDPGTVKGTGPGGRVLKEDALRHVERQLVGGGANGQPGTPPGGGPRETERVPMTRLRTRIAERLVESQQTAALLTTFNEIDMSRVVALRKEYKETFIEAHGVKLGFMSFFIKATIEALKLIPAVNAKIDDGDIVYHNFYDIGVAVGGGRGLVVPVIRNAERLSFAAIEKTIQDFAARAKDNTLELDELQGGTFTISNGGVYGSMMSTPIVNPPQSGILGLHAIKDRPVAIDGQVVVRPMMYVALTYDHRVVDGRESVTFLKRIKECIENPSRILLEI